MPALRAKRGSGGAQRGPRAVVPAWVAGIEGERVSRGADVGPENTDCQRFGGPGPRSLRLAARNRNGCGWRGPGQIRPRPTAFFAYIANLAAQVALGCGRATAADSLSLDARTTQSAPPTQELSAYALRPERQRGGSRRSCGNERVAPSTANGAWTLHGGAEPRTGSGCGLDVFEQSSASRPVASFARPPGAKYGLWRLEANRLSCVMKASVVIGMRTRR